VAKGKTVSDPGAVFRYPHTHPAALHAPGFWLAKGQSAGALGGVDMWVTEIDSFQIAAPIDFL
jgi:hypothetical protein